MSPPVARALIQDAVLADGLRDMPRVRVGGGRPVAGALIEPGGQALADGSGKRDDPPVEMEPPVANVCEFEAGESR
jgi:hypothetical protein